MQTYPTQIERVGENRLKITWSDSQQRLYTVRQLRDRCPCATCREKSNAPPKPATMLTVLKPEETRPLRIESMKPVGTYAYSIHFSDGHDTGIFTFDLLREIGEQVTA